MIRISQHGPEKEICQGNFDCVFATSALILLFLTLHIQSPPYNQAVYSPIRDYLILQVVSYVTSNLYCQAEMRSKGHNSIQQHVQIFISKLEPLNQFFLNLCSYLENTKMSQLLLASVVMIPIKGHSDCSKLSRFASFVILFPKHSTYSPNIKNVTWSCFNFKHASTYS